MRTKLKPVPASPPLHRTDEFLVTIKMPDFWTAEEVQQAVQAAVGDVQRQVFWSVGPGGQPEPATVRPAV